MRRPTRRVPSGYEGEGEGEKCAGLVMIVEKRSVRPWCYVDISGYRNIVKIVIISAIRSERMSRRLRDGMGGEGKQGGRRRNTDFKDSINIDLVRVGQANERRIG